MANLRATEIGKTIRLATGYNMQNKTSVTATITDSGGTAVTVADSRITIPASSYSSATLGTLAAYEYATFTTLATDFPSSGTYSIYVTYVDTVSTFYSDVASVSVTAVGS
jgi:hypothetical protein